MSINPENASAVAAPYSRAQKVYVRNVIIELFGAMRELSLKQFLTDDMYLFFVTMIEEVLLARTNATNGRAFKAKIDLVRSFVNQNGRPFRASVEQVEAAIPELRRERRPLERPDADGEQVGPERDREGGGHASIVGLGRRS